jgi:hypothetical protein
MAGDEQRKESKMKNTIKVTSLIVLVAAAIFAATVGAVSDARADDDPPPPPGGGSWGMASPTPTPNNSVQMADPGFDTILGELQPIIPAGDLQPAPAPAPNNNPQIVIPDCWDTVLGCREPNPDILKELKPVAGGSGNQDGSDNAGGSNDNGGSSDTDGSDDSGGSDNADGSSNPSGSSDTGGSNNAGGSSDPSGSINSGNPSLPNAGTGTTSSATHGSQSGLILVVLIIAGFAVVLALLFTAWRMKRSER